MEPLSHTIENPSTLGVNIDRLADAAKLDVAISEFSRFYLERRAQEMQAAGGDGRKEKKLEDEFTPRLEMTLVALEGKLHRQLKVKAQYTLDAESEYHSILTVTPHMGELVDAPEFGTCARSGKTVPKTCLKQCQITGTVVLQHLLARSETSSRLALPEFTVLCSLSGKLAATLRPNPILRIDPQIGQKCKGCEYRVPEEEGRPNGFRECWGTLADAKPHVLDLYRVDLLGGKKRDVVAEMATTGKAHLKDISDACL